VSGKYRLEYPADADITNRYSLIDGPAPGIIAYGLYANYAAVKSHLTGCSSCTNRLSNVTGVFLKILKLKTRHMEVYEGIEKGRDHRVSFDSPRANAGLQPIFACKVSSSDHGCLSEWFTHLQFVSRGTLGQVVIEEAIILGGDYS
jgi:hypothetical protein